MRPRRLQRFLLAFVGALLISPTPVHSQSACFSGVPPDRRVVYEQPVSVNTDVLLNTTFYPFSDAAITVTNAPTSINGITTLRWTSTFPNQDNTMVSTKASSISEVSPSPTHSDEVFVLIATDHQGNHKRQSGSYFVSSNGTITNDCTTSPIYTARNGVLTATLDGVVYTYSTSQGVGAAMFVPSTVPGSITTTFTIGSNALLQWQNEAFYNGQASFCAMKNGTVFAVFMQDAQPEGCLFISLSLFSVSSCQAISFATITGPQDKSAERGDRTECIKLTPITDPWQHRSNRPIRVSGLTNGLRANDLLTCTYQSPSGPIVSNFGKQIASIGRPLTKARAPPAKQISHAHRSLLLVRN